MTFVALEELVSVGCLRHNLPRPILPYRWWIRTAANVVYERP